MRATLVVTVIAIAFGFAFPAASEPILYGDGVSETQLSRFVSGGRSMRFSLATKGTRKQLQISAMGEHAIDIVQFYLSRGEAKALLKQLQDAIAKMESE